MRTACSKRVRIWTAPHADTCERCSPGAEQQAAPIAYREATRLDPDSLEHPFFVFHFSFETAAMKALREASDPTPHESGYSGESFSKWRSPSQTTTDESTTTDAGSDTGDSDESEVEVLLPSK